MINFEWDFTHGETEGSSFNLFAYGYSVVPALFVTKTILSPLNSLGTSVKNRLIINVYPVQASTLSTLHANPILPVIKWLAYGICFHKYFLKSKII